ncbi:MAG: PilZ domain-containing protein, partial [Campylobacterales bacterium]|nr:PilZ domain-containing protein [Campylobacterales bacterium]
DRYAILHKFRFLDYNPNERQHGRVRSDKIVPVAISLIGLKVKGEMIDISATSIAVKIKKTRALNNIINKEVGLTFYVDNPKIRGASVKLKESAVVLHESEADEHGNIKLTCIFNENMHNENILIDYIFNRQKSIIQHIKNRVS